VLSQLRVIIFSWEFPPRIVGELSYHVNRLAVELVKKGLDVYVVTYNSSWTGFHEGADGVKAYRISDPFQPHINILTWALSLNQEAERVAADVYYSDKREVNLIDVHDWHFIPAAASLKRALKIPFVFSIDSLEDHRSHGSNAPLNLAIKTIESLGIDEAERVIVKSDWMKHEMSQRYSAQLEKVEVASPDSPKWIDEILAAYQKRMRVIAL
jgi:glycosyltransferase involved in cell wall biosynthesis